MDGFLSEETILQLHPRPELASALALLFAGALWSQTPAAQALTQMASLLQQRKPAEALQAASAALAAEPHNPELLNARGAILASQNELTLARHDFEQAVRLDPKQVSSWQNLAGMPIAAGLLQL